MKILQAVIISVSVLLPATHAIATPAGEWTQVEGSINESQPISIGEVIYDAGQVMRISYTMMKKNIVYRFVGVENNNIKVESTLQSGQSFPDTDMESTVTMLSLPINAKKQALLKVDPKYSVFKSPSRGELVITIIDDFNRIKVEELRS